MNILVTAFEPFGGDLKNPSMEALNQLSFEQEGWVLKKVILPVSYLRAKDAIIDLITSFKPDVLLMTGVAKGRKGITIERIAVNIQDSLTPDCDHIIKTGQRINLKGHVGYFATLPLEDIAATLNQMKIDASISNSAGTYVCNTVMYQALELLTSLEKHQVKAGFIHVPAAKEFQTDNETSSEMSLGDITKAIEYALITTIKT